jgi:methylthioribose-1-phosphate isomerase
MRDPREIREINGNLVTVKDCPVLNPAFDVTPHQLLTAIITEKGVFKPPFVKTLKRYFEVDGIS